MGSQSSKKVFFRADASFEIGYGHFIRSLALADMLKDNFECVFFTCHPTSYQKQEMGKVCNFVELDETTHYEAFLSYLHGDETVVLDNYFFTTDYQRQIKAKGCRLVCIDDMHDKHYVADLVINHAIGVTDRDYSVEKYTQLCLGLSYALLRPPFMNKFSIRRIKSKYNLLIAFGGSDDFNLTMKYVEAVCEMSELDTIYVIAGDAYLWIDDLNHLAQCNNRIKVYSNISAEKVAELMSDSDWAFLPASTLLWEGIFTGLRIIYGYYIDNQKNICSQVGSSDYYGLTCIGDLCKYDVDDIQSIFRKGLQSLSCNSFVERFQPNSVKLTMNKIFDSDISVREAKAEDILLYFNWANDPSVRKFAFHTDRISFESHSQWFEKKLRSNESILCLCYSNETPVGQVRFDKVEKGLYIDISIDATYRGKGYGKKVLNSAIDYVFYKYGFHNFISEVKEENVASVNLFLSTGFAMVEKKKGVLCFQLSKSTM